MSSYTDRLVEIVADMDLERAEARERRAAKKAIRARYHASVQAAAVLDTKLNKLRSGGNPNS